MRGVLLLLVLLSFVYASPYQSYIEQCAFLGCSDASRSLYVVSSSGGPLNTLYIPESGSAVVTFFIKNYDVRNTGYVCIEGHGVDVSAENYEGRICFAVSPLSTVPVSLSVSVPPVYESGEYVGDIYVYLSGSLHKISVYVGSPPSFFGLPVYVVAVPIVLILLVLLARFFL